jgi:hypothetical protein
MHDIGYSFEMTCGLAAVHRIFSLTARYRFILRFDSVGGAVMQRPVAAGA